MNNILDYSISDLIEYMLSAGEKRFRAEQVFKWLSKGISSFEQMSDISNKLREKLESDFYIGLPASVIYQESKKDATRKVLFKLNEREEGTSELIESVFMKYNYGNTICISSQLGCRMGCKFCASTQNGLARGLTAGEMYGQVLSMCNVTGERMDHVVVMGIGEPFDNYDELSKFIELIHEPKGYNLSLRNITVSTCGLIPYIYKFAKDFPQVNLAISLHAPNDDIRKNLMPIANKYSFDDLLKACSRYTDKTHRRITFEYALTGNVNDSTEDAEELAKALSGMLCHVNLIPLNTVDNTGLSSTSKKNIEIFKSILNDRGIPVTVRRKLGSDIDAACGQLRAKNS